MEASEAALVLAVGGSKAVPALAAEGSAAGFLKASETSGGAAGSSGAARVTLVLAARDSPAGSSGVAIPRGSADVI